MQEGRGSEWFAVERFASFASPAHAGSSCRLDSSVSPGNSRPDSVLGSFPFRLGHSRFEATGIAPRLILYEAPGTFHASVLVL